MEKIAILTGGDSAEYNISLLSAKTVLEHLNTSKYKGIIVHLKNGEYTIDNQKINTSDFSYIKGNAKIKFDKIFIALHGPPAENGLIQDYFDSINLPYSSCNAKISALTFDKFECNSTLTKLGFRCANSMLIYSNKKFSETEIIDKVGLPCFVKPNGAGSSYGISKVTKKADLSKALKDAFLHDHKVIIESFINGTEVSCGVYFDGKQANALPITEIVSENDFFDYEAKYEGKSQEITPARISTQLTSEIQTTTIDIYKKMNLSGICRVDFIIQNDKPYILEINTIPGLSEESIIPKQLKVANISLSEIFDLLLRNSN
ncbi:MAG: D-alanine--D-alanine ligase [Pelagibacterales bacterium]|nr:D-alanine--D-alanine ligase [Pelagibacterales bacterium]